MENPCYIWLHRLLKESGLAGRLRVRRWLVVAGFAGSLAALWWFGVVGPEALLGMAVFGTFWGGAGGRGSDEPLPPVWWKMLEELMKQLGPKPEPEGFPPFHLPELPPIDLEQSRWPTSYPGPMDAERALRDESERIARRFQEAVGKLALDPKKAVEEFFRSLSSPPTLQFEMSTPSRPAGRPKAKEETFTRRLERLAREPKPREETFSERLEQLARQPKTRELTFTERLEQLAREEAEGGRKAAQRKKRKREAQTKQSQQKGERRDSKRQDERNLTDAFLKFKKETPVLLRLGIATGLLERGEFLVKEGIRVMTMPIPGSRIAGVTLVAIGATLASVGLIIFLDILGIFDWEAESLRVHDAPGP